MELLNPNYLLLLEALQNRIDVVERIVDFLPHFGTGKYHLSGHEYQQHNSRLHHPVDQPREQFRLVGAELTVR